MVTSHLEAVRELHAWRTNFDRILKRSVFIVYELNTPWDPSVSSVFSRDDAPLSTLYPLIELPSCIANLSQGPAPPPPPWSWRDVPVLLSRPPP